MNLISVKDINAPELDIFARYTEPQLRGCFAPDPGLFLAETGSVILRALEAGYEPVSMLVETERLEAEARPVFEAVEKHCGKNERLPRVCWTVRKRFRINSERSSPCGGSCTGRRKPRKEREVM